MNTKNAGWLKQIVGLFLIWGGASTMAHAETLRPPSVPLVACDPYFSIWSPADKLTDAATTHWTGKQQRLTSLVRIDGKTFRLMGSEPAEVPALFTRMSSLPKVATVSATSLAQSSTERTSAATVSTRPPAAYFLRHLVKRCATASGDDDPCTFQRQPYSNCPSQSQRAAGDQCHPGVQSEIHLIAFITV